MYLFYERFGAQFLRTDIRQFIHYPESSIWRDFQLNLYVMDDYGDLVCIYHESR